MNFDMTAKEYHRFVSRLRAYRQAFWKFNAQMQPDKCAAILPRLKLLESQEIEMYNKYIQQ